MSYVGFITIVEDQRQNLFLNLKNRDLISERTYYLVIYVTS